MPHCYVHTVAELMTYLGKKYDNFVYSSIAKIWKLAKLFRTPHYKSIGKWRSARNAKIGTSFPRSGHRKTLKFAARSEHQNLGFQPRTKDSERVPILGIQNRAPILWRAYSPMDLQCVFSHSLCPSFTPSAPEGGCRNPVLGVCCMSMPGERCKHSHGLRACNIGLAEAGHGSFRQGDVTYEGTETLP